MVDPTAADPTAVNLATTGLATTGLRVTGLTVAYVSSSPRARGRQAAASSKKIAVAEVDLHISPGKILALLGPSGCGKSSLLRAVAGLEPLASGVVTWDDVDLSPVPVHQRGFGLVFQDGQLFPHRSVGGNVGYAVPRRDRQQRVTELLDLVGMPGTLTRDINSLSGGERQRVALARSLAPRPRLLLLDEPLSALDRGLRAQLADELRQVLKATGTTALFVTHDQHEAFAVADEVAVMDDGKLLQVGVPAQMWLRPASQTVAKFLGFGSFVRTEGKLLALGPGAAQLDPQGDVVGQVQGAVARPGHWEVTVQVPDVGAVTAHLPLASEIPAGEVRIKWDETRTAEIAE